MSVLHLFPGVTGESVWDLEWRTWSVMALAVDDHAETVRKNREAAPRRRR